MENCQLVHCEDRGPGLHGDQKVTPGGAMTPDPSPAGGAMTPDPSPAGGAMTPDPSPAGGAMTPDPCPAELAQCQVEMGTLLTSIAELNKKIGKLKAPREPEDFKPSRVSKPGLPGLWAHRLFPGGPEKHKGPKPQTPLNREGRRELWPKLQKALTAVERSINTRRKWAILTTATDLVRQTEHLVAAEAITTSATQILQEIERELGISFPPAMPNIERPQGHDVRLNSSFQAETNASFRPPDTLPQMEEMSSLRKKLEGLQKAWSSGSLGPLYSPSGTSPCGPRSPELASPPPYPGSPLLLRRPMRAFTAPLSTVRDNSPPASPRPALVALSTSPTSSSASSHESETERLQRCIERLRARNQRLTTALERRKGQPQQVQTPLGCSQVDRSTLQMALAYCQECEEAYSELLSLYELNKQQGVEVCQFPASGDPSHRFSYPEVHELSTSFSTAGGAGDGRTPAGQRSASLGREAALRLHIEALKRGGTATGLLRPGRQGGRTLVLDPGSTLVLDPGSTLVLDPGSTLVLDPGSTLGLDPGSTLVQARDGLETKEEEHAGAGREKSLPFEELFTIGEEMAERSAETQLAEEELRCLDWALQALKAQDSPPSHPPPSPRVELLRRAEPQVGERCQLSAVTLRDLGDLHTFTESKKSQLVFPSREQGLKKRLSLVRESLATALRDSGPRRRDSDDHKSRKAVSSHRSSRRKYQEQVWRLEQKVSAISQSHQSQIAGLKATVEALERREETAL
ncbi:unnamed protein product [Lota lota]